MKKVLLALALSAAFAGCKESNKEKEALPREEPQAETAANVKDSVDYKAFGVEETDIPQGLAVGDTAPDMLVTTADNKSIPLKDLYKEQPLVVIFYRGYWCPVCIRHLGEFAKQAQAIEQKGAKLVAITPETYDNVAVTKEKTGADFTIVSDADGSIMKAFDVDFNVREEYQDMIQEKLNASIAETNATGKAVLPVPATYIIDTNGKIVYRQFNPNYRERASVQEIIDNLPAKKQ